MLPFPNRWVLIRGLGREARHWHEFPALFSRALGGAHVCCLDLPGTGSRRDRSSPTTIREIALDLLGQWPSSEADEPPATWGVLGVSLGGMVALELHEIAPESTGPTIVINASSNLNRRAQRLKWPAARALLEITLTRDALHRERKVGALTLHRATTDDSMYRERAAISKSSPIGLVTFVRQMMAASRFEPPALSAAPLLFLSSTTDKMVAPECSEALATYYSAPHRAHPWAGHDLPIDDPEWVCKEARRWLEGGKNTTVLRVI